MKIELALDRAGLFWSGLGVSLHVAREARAEGERLLRWTRHGSGSRTFRVGGLEGVISRA